MSNSAFTPQTVLSTSGVTAGSYGDAGDVPALTVNSAGQITAAVSTPISYTGGFINKLRNPGMDIWQRGTSLTITTSGAYAADGWIVTPTGASISVIKGVALQYTAASMELTGTTGVTATSVKQRIESSIVGPLNAQQVTFQAIIFNNTGAALVPTLTVVTPTAVDNFAGAGTTLVSAASLQSISNGGAAVVAYTFNNPVQSTITGLEFTLNFGSALNSNTKNIYITQCDVRATPGIATGTNNSPPPFEYRPYPTELAFCQRYLHVITSSVNGFVGLGWTANLTTGTTPSISGGTNALQEYFINLPVSMRTVPSATFPGLTSLNLQYGAAGTTIYLGVSNGNIATINVFPFQTITAASAGNIAFGAAQARWAVAAGTTSQFVISAEL